MALNAGVDVVIDNAETVVSGSGLKLELYNADVAGIALPAMQPIGYSMAPFSTERPCEQQDRDRVQAARVAIKRDVARRANAYGQAIVNHVKNNGTAIISVNTVCGRMSNPLQANANIQPPASNVLLELQ